jgi:hypothetical protein
MHLPELIYPCTEPGAIRNGDGHHYSDSVYAGELIRRFNQSAEVSAVNQLLDHCEPLLRSQFEYRGTVRHVPIEDLLAVARIKIWKSLPLFDVNRGTAFSFVSPNCYFGRDELGCGNLATY